MYQIFISSIPSVTSSFFTILWSFHTIKPGCYFHLFKHSMQTFIKTSSGCSLLGKKRKKLSLISLAHLRKCVYSVQSVYTCTSHPIPLPHLCLWLYKCICKFMNVYTYKGVCSCVHVNIYLYIDADETLNKTLYKKEYYNINGPHQWTETELAY